MAQEFESENYRTKIIQRFEEMLKKDHNLFLDTETFLDIIEYYLEVGQFEQALKASEMAIDIHPYSTELLQSKANVLVNLYRIKEAKEIIAYLKNIMPNDNEILLLEESIATQEGNYKLSIDLLSHIISVNHEERDDVYIRLAFSYQSINNHEKAVFYYKKALSINPNQENIIDELLFCLDILDKLPSAIVFFESLVDKEPYSKEAWYNLGSIQNKLEDFKASCQAFEYATLIDESFGKAHLALGHAFMNLKKYDDARKSYLIALDLEGESPDLICSLGATYEYTKNYETALRYYKQASELEYMWHEAWYGLGTCALALEKWQQAIYFLKKADEIDEGNGLYLLAIADAEYQMGNINTSSDYYEKADNHGCEDTRLWLNWSLLYYNEQDYLKSVEIIKEGLEEFPDDSKLYYRLVVYLLCAGMFKEAFNHLEIALSLDFKGHESIYDFFPDLETQKILYQIIESHKPQ